MIRPVTGPFVVHVDDDLVEVVARGSGPAGAIGIELSGGEISIDVDGADINQLVAVRFPVNGVLSAEQRLFIDTFFGDAAADVLNAGRQPRRVGVRRRNAFSNDTTEVDPKLSLLLVGADALRRSIAAPPVEALLALEVLVAAAACDLTLEPDLLEHCRRMLEHLPRKFPVSGLDRDWQETLSQAVTLGVLDAPPDPVTPRGAAGTTVVPLLPARHVLAPFESTSYSRAAAPTTSGRTPAPDAPVTLDPLSIARDGVSWYWAGKTTLRVTMPTTGTDEPLWARVRGLDGTILGASPLLEQETTRREAHILVTPREDLILDVVPEVRSRVTNDRVAALSRAAACGQRGARLERLGDLDEAALAWEECAAWHRIVGDAPREKLAMVRSDNPAGGTPSLLDALLENTPPR